MKKFLLALLLGLGSLAEAQSLPVLPRSTRSNGLGDTSLYMTSDTARRTRAVTTLDLRRVLAVTAWDSLKSTTWLRSSLGSLAAPTLGFTGFPKVGFYKKGAGGDTLAISAGDSNMVQFYFDGSQNRAVMRHTASVTGLRMGATPGSSTYNVAFFGNGVDIAEFRAISGTTPYFQMKGSARGCGSTNGHIQFSDIDSQNGFGLGSANNYLFCTGNDTLFSITGNGASGVITLKGNNGTMAIQSGTGNSSTMTLQTTTSTGVVKNVLTLGADSSVTALGQFKSINSNPFQANYTDGTYAMVVRAGTNTTPSIDLREKTNGMSASFALGTDSTIRWNAGGGERILQAHSITGTVTTSGDSLLLASATPAPAGGRTGGAVLRGGAGNMSVIPGTGASRKLLLGSTTSGSAVQTVLTLADTAVTITAPNAAGNGINKIWFGSGGPYIGASSTDTLLLGYTNGGAALRVSGLKLIGAANNSLTLLGGTGASRTITLQTTTAASAVKNTLVLGADSSATFLGAVIAPAANNGFVPFRFAGTTTGLSYNSAGNGLVLTYNGNAQMYVAQNIKPATQMQAITGDAASPGLSAQNDSTTGFSYQGTGAGGDTITLSTGATSRLRFATQAATAAGDVALCVTTTGVTKVVTQGATCGSSSSKVKTGFGSIFDPVSKTMALRPQFYSYIPSVYEGRSEYGLLAEATAAVDSTLVFRAPEDQVLPNGKTIKKGEPFNVNDRAVLSLLIATVQKQQAQIDSLMKLVARKP